jgi:hypothetical protein
LDGYHTFNDAPVGGNALTVTFWGGDALTKHYRDAAVTQADVRRVEASLALVIAKMEAMAEILKELATEWDVRAN